jgi:hypothetical protein
MKFRRLPAIVLFGTFTTVTLGLYGAVAMDNPVMVEDEDDEATGTHPCVIYCGTIRYEVARCYDGTKCCGWSWCETPYSPYMGCCAAGTTYCSAWIDAQGQPHWQCTDINGPNP